VYRRATEKQGLLGTKHLPTHYGHFTTRQNVQFNWIPLAKSADVMDLLATVDMHGIQTSGNCIRNITSDERAGVAHDEIADPRPFAEIMRQWSTLHPEFAFLPRKFKIAITGAAEDRAATGWHDVGLHLVKNEAGELGFRVQVGGGMGRTPIIGTVLREFLPWNQIMNYLEAVVRVYNRYGRRDNIYKARIKILVKAEGQRYIDDVEAEYKQIVEHDGGPHTITQSEFDRVAASFVPPALATRVLQSAEKTEAELQRHAADDVMFARWLARNVAPHQNPALRAVTLSFKRLKQAPGDASADQLDTAARLADRFSAGEARVTHDQNLLLPWVHAEDLHALWLAAREAGFASANVRLLTDMIACPGGDFCDLANARSIPIAEAITERYQDLDELDDLGEIDLHISGCINSCGHHHSGHIGILGVDKDGKEWYQVTLAGSDGSDLSGTPQAGKVVGPSFTAAEVPEVIEAVLTTYRDSRQVIDGKRETFIDTLRRVGPDPFKAAANGARFKAEEVTA
jgi:sulfite reductase (NADPH) hemoprotein beta-component